MMIWKNVVCGVDFGNLALVKAIQDRFGWDLAIIEKLRVSKDGTTESDTISNLIHGDVRGKRVILFDDMISSGGTLIRTIEELLDHGAAEIVICATHAVFDPRKYYSNMKQLIKNDKVKIVMTSNTIPLKRPDRNQRPTTKSKPYIAVDEDGEEVRKEVVFFDAHPFIEQIVRVAALSDGKPDAMREALKDHLIPEAMENKHELYKKLTGDQYQPPKIRGFYLGGGRVDFF